MLAKIFSFLGAGLAKVFSDKILLFVAIKAVAVFLFVVVVPILLNNFMYDLIEIMMNFASAQTGGVMNGEMAFSGFMAYLVEAFCLPQALSILVSALALRISLKMIPMSPI